MDTRKIRRRLFAESLGFCQFCGISTVLPDVLVRRYTPARYGNRNWTKTVEHLIRDNREFHAIWHSDLATIEHVLPIGAGGTWRRENLKLACYRCNQRRARLFAKGLKANQKRGAAHQAMVWSVINDCWIEEPA